MMDQDHSPDAPDPARVDFTHWSVVLAAAQSGVPRSPEALADLCARYWRLLYTFVQGQRHSPEGARDLIEGFFEHLIRSRTQLMRPELECTVEDPAEVEAESRGLREALPAAEGRVRT
ncbi:MAG: hypothetical protein JO015_01995 [Verrucomicrobia bacterium]|nr:hypothetical protein [Verrucomicrobiota bacterium]